MKNNPKVIERLNTALQMELGAINQYLLHSKLLEDMGVTKLAAKEMEESIEEREHAERYLDRIIFLGGTPNVQEIGKIHSGSTVREMLEGDLIGEKEAVAYYSESRRICEEEGDYVTMRLFEEILADEEGHCDFLETQFDLIEKLGIENYIKLNSGSADTAE
ncbi:MULTISPECIES: bacterioferritin [Pseudovibrio]|uniref:bacterioferritin n=1 Tax=Stappiaceae TaxID=2821832 RepID=UPI002366C5F6|nr:MULTISPECIES: bacterioferritin [Pseudovibrio]MDD7910653.1 bacterioferritin [Pseudovibrio exalbescens]MDX5594508.1 bacterioferritin [Pseudovibrio sp. SPO723]